MARRRLLPRLTRRGRLRLLRSLAFFLVLLCFCLAFRAGPCYEGDDIFYAGGGYFLRDALAGRVRLYRYDLQPLSYWIIHAAYRATGHVGISGALSASLGALGVAFLFAVIIRRPRRGVLLPVAASILLVPELMQSCLYTNTMAIALPFVTLPILLLIDGGGEAGPAWRSWARIVVAAVSFAVGCLCRFPAAVATPAMVAMILYAWPRRWTKALVFLGVLAGMLALSWLLGLFRPEAILACFEGHARSSTIPRLGKRLLIAATGINVLGWGLLFAGVGVQVAAAVRRRAFRAIVWVPAALVLAAPMLIATTPKYLTMFYAFAAIFLAGAIADLYSRLAPRLRAPLRRFLVLWIAVVQFLTIAPSPYVPFVDVATMLPPIRTDDGVRFWGTYARQYAITRRVVQFAKPNADKVSRKVKASPANYWIIVKDGGWNAFPAVHHLLIAFLKNGWQPDIRSEAIVFDRGKTTIVLVTPAQLKLPACRSLYATRARWKVMTLLRPERRKDIRWPLRP